MDDKRIWKYVLRETNVQILDLPWNAMFLKILVLSGVPYLYALVDFTSIIVFNYSCLSRAFQ